MASQEIIEAVKKALDEAKEIADIVIQPEDLEKITKDAKEAKKIAEEHDFFLAESPLMPTIGKSLGRVLAPRGKMPKPLPPDADVVPQIEKLWNTIRIRSRDKLTFHCLVGNEEMGVEDIADNVEAVLKAIEGKLERGRMNIRSAYVKTTMGSPVRVV
ncbi:hypothetical protein B6U81_01960 [Thermoplasmatales archaeon ex4484_30]|nr:MAG: hypothetical protein B6U81_01960 [Thermoplasmatales archaeon ex4484_30]